MIPYHHPMIPYHHHIEKHITSGRWELRNKPQYLQGVGGRFTNFWLVMMWDGCCLVLARALYPQLALLLPPTRSDDPRASHTL